MLEQTISYQLAIVAGAVRQRSRSVVAERGITPRTFEALVAVQRLAPVKQADLARALSISPSTLVAVLDDLETRALVRRRRDETDRRGQFVALEPDGESLLAEVERTAAEDDAELTAYLDAPEAEAFRAALAKIVTGVRGTHPG